MAERHNTYITMTNRRFDLIAFDWDGTLFDSTGIIARSIQAAVRDVGGREPTREQASYVIGMGLMEALAHAAPDVPQALHGQLVERYRHHYFASQHDIVLFDGVLPMLQALKRRGHLLVVATGKSRRGLDEALGNVALARVFDGSRTADQTAGKPDPMMMHELMAEFDVTPQRSLMIGDTTHDLQMALNAGCASVGVSYGAHEAHTFDLFNPLFVAHDVAQLQAWLLSHA